MYWEVLLKKFIIWNNFYLLLTILHYKEESLAKILSRTKYADHNHILLKVGKFAFKKVYKVHKNVLTQSKQKIIIMASR